jgi:hypothetical protein
MDSWFGFLKSIYVNFKKVIVSLQMCNIIFFTHLNFKKPFVGPQVCNIIFSLHLYEHKKPLMGSQVCNIIFFCFHDFLIIVIVIVL